MREAAAPQADLLARAEKGTSLWHDAWLRLRRNRLAVGGAITLVVITAACVAGPWFVPYGYDETQITAAAGGITGATAPSGQHWFGTDRLGRDLLVRVLHGGRISLLVGFAATGVSLLIGVVYGGIAGYAGGRTDEVMMRFVDVLYALPYTMFIIILMVWFGRNLALLFLAIGAIQWLTMARIVRGQVQSLVKKEFIEATRVLGLPAHRVLFRHLLPNALGPIIVYATLTIPNIMLLEAVLSFLGLGIQPPMSSWGILINEGVDTMEEYPWMLLFPSVFLSVTLFSLNFLGDGLRDALDPQAGRD